MADKKFPVHYANFVCHFGEAELLDYLDEIVIPAFTGGGVRTFKDGTYRLNSVEILDLGTAKAHSDLALCGRFIKDMVVRSEQRYDAETDTVVPDRKQMETAPSALFALLLASHKLIYLSETAHAPGLESFRSTIASLLGKARVAYIDGIHMRSGLGVLTPEEKMRFSGVADADSFDGQTAALPSEDADEGTPTKLTKRRLRELVPPVDLEVLPLSNDEELRAFVARFKTLQSATLRLVKPNSELDNDDFLAQVRGKAEKAGSQTSTLVYRNPDGLNKAQIVAQFETAAAEGNTEIKLDGKDQVGQTLRGSNNEFKVVSYLTSLPADLRRTARAMFLLFKQQRGSGLIKAPDHELKDRAKLRLTLLANEVPDAGNGEA